MAQPWKDPRSGIYYIRRRVPKDMMPYLPQLGEFYKRSLETTCPHTAKDRHAVEWAKSKELFDLTRRQAHADLTGKYTLLPADTPKLADRWIAAELAAWERDNDLIHLFLAHSGGDVVTPLEVMDEECPSLQPPLADAMRKTLAAVGHPVPSSPSPTHTALHRELFLAWQALCEAALQRHHGDWRAAPAMPAASLPLSLGVPSQGRIGKGPRLSEVLALWAESKRQDNAGLSGISKTIAEYEDCMQRLIRVIGNVPVDQVSKATIHNYRVALGQLPKGRWKSGLSVEALRAQVEHGGASSMQLATMRKKLSALSSIFKFACDRLDAISEDPR